MAQIDKEIVNDFIDESKELLQSIEDDFLMLEKSAPPDLINRLFRAIHTIKGGAGFIGMHNIAKLAHIIENILSKIRDGKIKPNTKYINALLTGADNLKTMINDIENSNQFDIEAIYALLDVLDKDYQNQLSANQPIPVIQEIPIEVENSGLDMQLITEFIPEARKYVDTIELGLTELQSKPNENPRDLLNKIFRALDTLKGTCRLIGLEQLSLLNEKIALVVKTIIDKKIKLNDDVINQIFIAVDKIHILLNDAPHSNSADLSELFDLLTQYTGIQKETSIEIQPENTLATKNVEITKKATVQPDEIANAITNELKLFDKTETVRLNITILDKLMRLAGELVLVRNQQLSIMEQIPGFGREVIQRLNSITSEIQETVMQTRLQPIGLIFNKFPRIIRELNQVLGKKIELTISGNDVELDKTIIEALAAPLTHLIRNAADHGIEPAEVRIANGKTAQGNISLNAFHESGFINITVADDGKGIDPIVIRQKVIEKNLKTQTELDKMSEKEILNLVFLPGFSTAITISDISGRGVGMDVVKNSIEKLSGFIDLTSTIGKGTEIVLKLPLTLAIIPCLIVAYGNYRFAIPQLNIEELVTIFTDSENKIENIGDQEVYRLRNKLISIVRLNEILLQPLRFTSAIRTEIVKKYHENKTEVVQENKIKINEFAIIRLGNNRYGLVFDYVVGTEEIVVKPLHPALKELRIYSGATILGDGKIAPILDLEGIASHANTDFNLKGKIVHEQKTASASGKIESILLFRNGVNEQFAIPVSLVKRIEPILSKNIEVVAGKEFIAINEVSHRIVRIENLLQVTPCMNTDELYLILLKHISRPVGILFSQLHDIQNVRVNISTDTYQADGILGTAIINHHMTLFIDAYRLIEMADPALYDKRLIQLNQMKESLVTSELLKVLVVDDSTVFRQMINNYLTHDGYEVHLVADGASALKVLNEQPFDLLVSDIEMPVMNGFELIENIRSSSLQKEIPALALSSNTNEETIRKALNSGFNEYLIKIDKDQLLNTLKSLLNRNKKNKEVIISIGN